MPLVLFDPHLRPEKMELAPPSNLLWPPAPSPSPPPPLPQNDGLHSDFKVLDSSQDHIGGIRTLVLVSAYKLFDEIPMRNKSITYKPSSEGQAVREEEYVGCDYMDLGGEVVELGFGLAKDEQC
ncbi:uncharacterized protein A4U43_C05F34640 [Asparagus officinalis]|uniref:Uncharacterized protein n=1 Tax=Asparagus officinalis TaxID=4686 RepID=A0A5P1EZF0_ASPOF|nr:uncharacterized protein A4U43_C05F34640 [Asparagus officinalis]